MEIRISEEKSDATDKKVIGTQVPIGIYESLKRISDEGFLTISGLLRKIVYQYLRSMGEEVA